jgi:hypothetical protein
MAQPVPAFAENPLSVDAFDGHLSPASLSRRLAKFGALAPLSRHCYACRAPLVPENHVMAVIRIVLQVISVLAVLIGLIWIGQGTGLFPYPASSFMINQTPWILRGAILAGVGVAVLLLVRRLR